MEGFEVATSFAKNSLAVLEKETGGQSEGQDGARASRTIWAHAGSRLAPHQTSDD